MVFLSVVLCNASAVADKKGAKHIMLWKSPQEITWNAPLESLQYSSERDTLTLVESNQRERQIQFQEPNELEKTIKTFKKRQERLLVAKNKGDEYDYDSNEEAEEILDWNHTGESYELQRTVKRLTAHIKEMENAYTSDFAVSLTTEIVSGAWLQAKYALEATNASPESAAAVQKALISFAAQENAQKSNLHKSVSLEESKNGVAKELQRLNDQSAHLGYLANVEKSAIQPKIIVKISDLEQDLAEEDKAKMKGQSLAARLNKSVFAAQESSYPHRSGELQYFSRHQKWQKRMVKSAGRYLYFFKLGNKDLSPVKTLMLQGGKVGPSTKFGGKFDFEIVNPDPRAEERDIVFRAESAQDYNDWVYLISILTGQ